MAGTWSLSRVRDRVDQLARSESDPTVLRAEVVRLLRPAIGFDAFVWVLTDPSTSVGVAPFAEVPCLADLPSLVKAKYTTALGRWTELRGQRSPVWLLAKATQGELHRSSVWRHVLHRYGVVDVASTVHADRYGTWAFLDLWRASDARRFAAPEVELLRTLAPSLTSGLRRCQAATFATTAASHHAAGGAVVVMLDDDLRIVGRTPGTEGWLDLLLPPSPDEPAIPASVYNVAAQLLAVEGGIDANEPMARTHLRDGFWITLRAARMGTEGSAPPQSGSIVVTIEQTAPADRLDLFARTHGLTARESELLRSLALGLDTRGLAKALTLSEHTVQDHLKSIFAKTGARDRLTLLSRALGTRDRRTL